MALNGHQFYLIGKLFLLVLLNGMLLSSEHSVSLMRIEEVDDASYITIDEQLSLNLGWFITQVHYSSCELFFF